MEPGSLPPPAHVGAPGIPDIDPPLASQAPAALQPKPLADLSLEAQEAVILEDLLFVFMGFEGQYIRFAKGYNPHEERDRLSGPSWRILPGLDPSLQDLTLSMLRMATHYSALETFVDVQSRAEFGSVNHALCASIRKFLHDYLVLISQLETQFLTNDSFTLHVLNIHVLPTSQMMFQLYAVALELLRKNALLDDEEADYDKIIDKLKEAGDLVPGNMTGKKICKGGVVLGLITKRLERHVGRSGGASPADAAPPRRQPAVHGDAERVAAPRRHQRPHSEFLIKEQRSIRARGWRKTTRTSTGSGDTRSATRRRRRSWKASRTRCCSRASISTWSASAAAWDVSKEVKDVPTSFDDNRFLDNVNNAYAHANESLMQLLLTTHALPARLRSLKHYFFLDPSDYFSYFLELGYSELRKPTKMVNTGKLQSLLDLVLRQPGSAVSLDPFKEDVKLEMNDITLIRSLQRVVNITGIEPGETLQPPANQPIETDKAATGFTALQIDYAVPFPVSLVISRKTIWRYQALFRYLLSLRYLELQLSSTWQTHTRDPTWARKSSSRNLEIWKRRIWTLRARMLVFVQQLLYFCTAEVIEPNWQSLMSRLEGKDGGPDGDGAKGPTRTVDELMQDHVDFLDTCLKECMLTNSKLLRVRRSALALRIPLLPLLSFPLLPEWTG